MKIFGYGLTFLLLLASCSVEKRHYRSGFYVSKKNYNEIKNITAPTARIEKVKPVNVSTIHFYTEPDKKKEPTIIASVDKIMRPETVKKFTHFVGPLENCDTIFLVDKTGIKAKVVEITATEVKYKYCDDQGGPLRSVSKYTVRYISYANGIKEVITPEYVPEVTNTRSQYEKPRARRQLNLLALSGFILGLLPYPVCIVMLYINLITYTGRGAAAFFSISAFYFPLFIAILALVVSVAAMVQISREKEKYKGWSFAIMGLAFSAVIALILLLVLTSI